MCLVLLHHRSLCLLFVFFNENLPVALLKFALYQAMNVLREFSARLNGASVRDHILRMVLRIIRQQVTRNDEQIVDEDNKENIKPSS
ncbi:hypothetical protein B9Z55_020969 [Caenorhabditis nigoni]|uniref:Secreted protein n=1 Tax=Caenorhabditis nigoni TaxID=1611254 RepID=A0A2G5TQ64_9PELO|nr:hypothetical protein B9Z55_020969 [Caenorhabditis nigoni]